MKFIETFGKLALSSVLVTVLGQQSLCVCIYTCVYTYTCMYIYKYMYISIYVFVYVCISIQTHTEIIYVSEKT